MRFQHTRWTRERLDIPVDFPVKGLDLDKFVLDKSIGNQYDLNGVTIHMGGPDGGHYIAYGKSHENGKWYCFNDSMVSNSSEDDVKNQSVGSYVLFYLKKGYGAGDDQSQAPTQAPTNTTTAMVDSANDNIVNSDDTGNNTPAATTGTATAGLFVDDRATDAMEVVD